MSACCLGWVCSECWMASLHIAGLCWSWRAVGSDCRKSRLEKWEQDCLSVSYVFVSQQAGPNQQVQSGHSQANISVRLLNIQNSARHLICGSTQPWAATRCLWCRVSVLCKSFGGHHPSLPPSLPSCVGVSSEAGQKATAQTNTATV